MSSGTKTIKGISTATHPQNTHRHHLMKNVVELLQVQLSCEFM